MRKNHFSKFLLLVVSTALLSGCHFNESSSRIPTTSSSEPTPTTTSTPAPTTSSEPTTSSSEPTPTTSSETTTSSSEPTTSSSETTTSSSKANVLTLDGDFDTTVYGGSKIEVEAYINGTYTTDVSWKTSDSSVATVSNGSVSFKDVIEIKQVKISAEYDYDETATAEILFTVNVFPINTSTSSPDTVDYSTYDTSGIAVSSARASALMFNNVFGTKFYSQVTFKADTVAKNKFLGIMIGTSSTGKYNDGTNKTLFFYLNTDDVSTTKMAWKLAYGIEGNAHKEFNTKVELADSPSISKGRDFTIGIMRDGIDYFFYYINGATRTCIGSVSTTSIPATTSTYCWLCSQDGVGYHAKEIIMEVGENADQYYDTPTRVTIAGQTSRTLVQGETTEIALEFDKKAYSIHKCNVNLSKSGVVTIDADGKVTAVSGGTTVITFTCVKGGASTSCSITVLGDLPDPVLDGVMNDEMWGDAVKANVRRMGYGSHSYTEFYASKNRNGVFIFAKQFVTNLKNTGSNWWEKDNIEMRLIPANYTGQDLYDFQIAASDEDVGGRGYTQNCEGFVTTSPTRGSTGNYEIMYELKIPYPSGCTYDTDLQIAFGCNLDAGWMTSRGWQDAPGLGDPNWGVRKNLQMHITPAGLKATGSGTEVLKNTITSKGMGYQQGYFLMEFPADSSFTVVSTMHITIPPEENPNFAHSFSGDICSDDFTSGGYSFRGDWFTWGSWAGGDRPFDADGGGICPGPWEVVHEIKQDMYVVLYVNYDANTRVIDVAYSYEALSGDKIGYNGYWWTSSLRTPVEEFLNFHGPVQYRLNRVDSTTTTTIELTSVKVLKGSDWVVKS